MKITLSRIFRVLLLAVFLTACGKVIPTATATPIPPTATLVPMLIATNTSTPTNTSKPTWTPTPTENPWDLRNLGPIAYYDISSHAISLINPDGSGMQILVPDQGHNIKDQSGFSWSPDGQSLAYSDHGWDDIFIYSIKEAQSHNITNLDGKFETEPDWSPDGKKIAFAGNVLSQEFNIYVMNADGSQIRKLTECSDGCRMPDWSPSGEYIAYRDNNDIYVMNSDGSGAIRLAHGGVNSNPAWSPDGSRIAFVRSAGFEEPTYLYLVNQDGTGARALTDTSINPQRFSWSPDGKYLVFDDFSPRRFGAMWILNVESGALKQITSYGAIAPEWSPILSAPANPDDVKPLPDCTSGWMQLKAGGQARVTGPVGSSPLRVRSKPEMGDNIVVLLPAGTVMDVLEGPVCADGLVFWKVHSMLIPGGTGWSAEGNGTEYWLEPYNP